MIQDAKKKNVNIIYVDVKLEGGLMIMEKTNISNIYEVSQKMKFEQDRLVRNMLIQPNVVHLKFIDEGLKDEKNIEIKINNNSDFKNSISFKHIDNSTIRKMHMGICAILEEFKDIEGVLLHNINSKTDDSDVCKTILHILQFAAEIISRDDCIFIIPVSGNAYPLIEFTEGAVLLSH